MHGPAAGYRHLLGDARTERVQSRAVRAGAAAHPEGAPSRYPGRSPVPARHDRTTRASCFCASPSSSVRRRRWTPLAADDVNDDDLILALGHVGAAAQAGGAARERRLGARAGAPRRCRGTARRTQAVRPGGAAYEQPGRRQSAAEKRALRLGRYFVATRQPEKAVAAYEQEIERAPDHVPAHLGIAAIKSDTDPATALRYAEEAVRLNSRIPLGHYLLGMLLLHTPDTAPRDHRARDRSAGGSRGSRCPLRARPRLRESGALS